MITCCHSLSLVVFVVSCCTTRCHSLYHSLSLVVPIAVTRCTTRCHSMYHSLSLDVSLVCLFINNNQISLLCKNFHKLFVHFGMKENKMKTGQPWIHLLKVTKKKTCFSERKISTGAHCHCWQIFSEKNRVRLSYVLLEQYLTISNEQIIKISFKQTSII